MMLFSQEENSGLQSLAVQEKNNTALKRNNFPIMATILRIPKDSSRFWLTLLVVALISSLPL